MKLVGITGAIGHGKTTLAEMIAKSEPKCENLESFYLIADVINDWHKATKTIPKPNDIDSLNEWLALLSPILQKHVHCECTLQQVALDPEHMEDHPEEYKKLLTYVRALKRNPDLAKHKITQKNKATYRPLLSWLGNYLPKKVDPGIWYTELISRAKNANKNGATLCIISGIRFPIDADIVRDAGGSVIKIYRPGFKQADLNDPTERERENIQVDCTVMNDGSLKDLEITAKQLLKDIRTNKLKTKYGEFAN